MDNQELLKRAQAAKTDRDVVQQTWDAIREFVIPYRGNFFEEYTSEGSIDWYQARRNTNTTRHVSRSLTHG